MLEPTLSYLYTGQLPLISRMTYDDPDHFFGLLSNAKYLILERLTEQCADVLGELIAINHQQGLIGHPSFGPELMPPSSMLYIFNKLDPSGNVPIEMQQRLISVACTWPDTDDED